MTDRLPRPRPLDESRRRYAANHMPAERVERMLTDLINGVLMHRSIAVTDAADGRT